MISSRDLTAVILAGGKTQKAAGTTASLLEVDGRKVIERQAQLLKGKVSRIEVSVSAPAPWSRFPVVLDSYDTIGPLAGIATALRYASTDYIIAIGAGYAWINPDVLDLLVARSGEPFDACAIRFNFANPNPLFAIYHKRCAQRAIDRLERGDHDAMGLLTSESLAVRWIEDYELASFDPEMTTFKLVGGPAAAPAAEPEMIAPAEAATNVMPVESIAALVTGTPSFDPAFQTSESYKLALSFVPIAYALAKLADAELGGQLVRAALAIPVAIAQGRGKREAALTCMALLDVLGVLGIDDPRLAEAQALVAKL